MSVDALTVARAALLEVGEDPALVYWGFHPGTQIKGLRGPATDVHTKARWLGRMAAEGPDVMTWCSDCTTRASAVPCTPVRDALRGVTCGRSS